MQWRNEFAEMSRACGGFSALQCDMLLEAQRLKEPSFNKQTCAIPSLTLYLLVLAALPGLSVHVSNVPCRMCSPAVEDMRQMLQNAMQVVGTENLYLASDVTLKKMKTGIGEMFAELGAKSQPGGLGRSGLFRPQVDLAALSGASLMIGHCPSSFTNVATRLRASQNRPTVRIKCLYSHCPTTNATSLCNCAKSFRLRLSGLLGLSRQRQIGP